MSFNSVRKLKVSYKRLTQNEELKLLKKCLENNDYSDFILQYSSLICYFINNTFSKKGFNKYTSEDVKDLRSDIIEKLYKSALKEYNPQRSLSLSGWVILITVRTTLNFIQKETRRNALCHFVSPKTPETCLVENYSTSNKDPDNEMSEIELLMSLNVTANMILPYREKTVFFLFWLENMSSEDIAHNLVISIAAVNTALSRAKKRLLHERHLFTDKY